MKVGAENSLINTGTFNDISIVNTTFANIDNQISTDSDNYMIVFDTIDLSSSQNSLVSNISIKNSSIAFINFNSIIGTTTSPVLFIMQDIFYSN